MNAFLNYDSDDLRFLGPHLQWLTCSSFEYARIHHQLDHFTELEVATLGSSSIGQMGEGGASMELRQIVRR